MQRKRQGLRTDELIDILACLEYREGDLGRFLDEIARGFSRVLGVDWTVVTLLEGEQRYKVVGDSTVDGRMNEGVFDLHGAVTARVIDAAEPYCIADARMDRETGSIPAGFIAYLGVPLQTAAGQVIGTVCSFHRTARRFQDKDVAVARVFAARATAAIEQHRATLALAAYNARLERAVERRTSELRAAQQQLIRRERLAAIGELSARVVHEVRSPLSTMTMAMDHLKQVDLPETSSRRLALAQEEADRLNRLLGEILSYASPEAGPVEWVDVDTCVVRTVADLVDAAGTASTAVPVRCRCGAGRLGVLANPDKLRQALINLLRNARDASPAGAHIVVETGKAGHQGLVSIRVRNRTKDGPLDSARVLEPFYSTKSGGTGLGLAIVTGIVEALHGRFSIEQDETGEVTAQLVLPTSAGAARESSVAARSGGSERSPRRFNDSSRWCT